MILTTFYLEDINKKKKKKKKKTQLFPTFQLIPILSLHIMHDYVHWHYSIDHCVKLSLVDKTFKMQKMALIS